MRNPLSVSFSVMMITEIVIQSSFCSWECIRASRWELNKQSVFSVHTGTHTHTYTAFPVFSHSSTEPECLVPAEYWMVAADWSSAWGAFPGRCCVWACSVFAFSTFNCSANKELQSFMTNDWPIKGFINRLCKSFLFNCKCRLWIEVLTP